MERLRNETGHHHAVLPHLARTDRIEETDHNRRQSKLPVVDEGEDLVDGLRGRVAPPQLSGRAEDPIVVLLERTVIALAVDLARGGHKDLDAMLLSRFEQVFGAFDVRD